MSEPIHYRETQYGFEYGAAKIQRAISDEKRGWVLISLETPKCHGQLYVTKTGKVRFYMNGKEWKE